VLIYRACELLTEIVIYGMVVFSPWAFGTTEPWSIWTMNILAYSLGLLWSLKRVTCWQSGYRPETCKAERISAEPGRNSLSRWQSGKWVTTGLGAVQIALLCYCLVSAVNARAIYLPEERRFEYLRCVEWLPHSFDGRSSWVGFWTYLGLAWSFWAIRDWLLGGWTRKPFQTDEAVPGAACRRTAPLPDRLARLLWVLTLNGGALALEGIVQRLAQSPKLLFLIQPRIHQSAIEEFGPFAYRANAAEYFNLLWPVCLGFWYARARRQQSVPGDGLRNRLMPGCVALMAACPIISTSRAGALVSVSLLAAAALGFLGTAVVPRRMPHHAYRFFDSPLARFNRCTQDGHRRGKPLKWLPAPPSPGTELKPGVNKRGRGLRCPNRLSFDLALFFLTAPVLGLALGWNTLGPRLMELREGYEGRQAIYHAASQIAADFPWYGTGPGTYASVSELYRPNPAGLWPAQVHNDWLETRITFGIAGSFLIGIAGILILLRCVMSAWHHDSLGFTRFIWLALLGCLIHARFDFPFQVHSVLFLFVLLTAVMFTFSERTTSPDSALRRKGIEHNGRCERGRDNRRLLRDQPQSRHPLQNNGSAIL
jgi:hypothetical protein